MLTLGGPGPAPQYHQSVQSSSEAADGDHQFLRIVTVSRVMLEWVHPVTMSVSPPSTPDSRPRGARTFYGFLKLHWEPETWEFPTAGDQLDMADFEGGQQKKKNLQVEPGAGPSSLFLLSDTNFIRRFTLFLIEWPPFEYTILLTIIGRRLFTRLCDRYN